MKRSESPTEVEGWIGAMEDKYEVNRDLADVRIYCGEWCLPYQVPCLWEDSEH